MPSHSDLTDTDGLTISAPAVTDTVAPADVLAAVKREGLRRRARRHRRNGVLAVLGLALVAMPALALLPGDDGGEDLTIAADPGGQDAAPTTADRTATTALPTTAPPVTVAVESDEVEPDTATTVPQAATTVPTPVGPTCRNSSDPACGEFRWDPAPAPNQPLTAAFVDAPATAAVGEQVTFSVAWSDPDATLAWESFSAEGVGLAGSCTTERRHGPWTPPDPQPGSGELAYTHAFEAPGEYTVVVSLASGDCNGPYYDEAQVTTTITVV